MKLIEGEPRGPAREPDAQDIQQSDVLLYVQALWRRKWVFLIAWVIVAGIGAYVSFKQPKVYKSSTSLVLAERSGGDTGSSSLGAALISQLMSVTGGLNVATQVEIIKSPDLIGEAFSEFTKEERIKGFGTPGGNPPKWAVTIDSAKDTEMLTVDTSSLVPELAQRLATNITKTYLDRDEQRTVEATAKGEKFVLQRMAMMQADLDKATWAVANYQTRSEIVVPDAEAAGATREIFALREEERQAELALKTAELSEGEAQRELKRLVPDVEVGRTVSENPDYAHIRDALGTLNDQLVLTEHEYRPDRPEVKKLKAAIKDEQDRIKPIVKEIVTLRRIDKNPLVEGALVTYATNEALRITSANRLAYAQKLLTQREDEFLRLPAKARNFLELKRQADELAHTLETLTDRYYELLITEKSGIPNAMVSDKAKIPTVPSSPNLQLDLVLCVLLGLLAAIAAALAAESIDRRIHDPAMVERLTGLPVLAAVPESNPISGQASLLIDHVEAGHAFLEAFRLLRNNVAFSNPDSVQRVLAITSAEKGDGKSTIAANFGIACGMDGKSVLLVDADLRRPSLHRVFGVERDRGFTNVVTGTCTFEEAVLQTGFENVAILPAGPLPPRPTEFLNSRNARELIESLRDRYDIVILDSPPCAGLSDFQVISKLIDGAMLVVCLEHTFKQSLWAAGRLLRQSGAPMLGTVLNRMSRSWNPYGAYNYYYYYYSYYGEDEAPSKRKRRGSKPKSSSK